MPPGNRGDLLPLPISWEAADEAVLQELADRGHLADYDETLNPAMANRCWVACINLVIN